MFLLFGNKNVDKLATFFFFFWQIMYDVICLGFSFPEIYKEQCRWQQFHENE